MLPALRLERIRVRGFRNLEPFEWTPGAHFNVLWGDNGAGKSNTLEAIEYVTSLASFRGASTRQLIARDRSSALSEQGARPGASLRGRFEAGGVPHEARIELPSEGQRAFELDGKRPRSIAAWRARLPTVVFHAGDLDLVQGAPERRRALLDRLLERTDPSYAGALSNYQRALRSRNRLLKDPSADLRSVQAYDPILASSGAQIGQARAQLVDELASAAHDAFESIAGGFAPGESGRLTVAYAPRVEPDAERLNQALRDAFSKDRQRGFTGDGPHADDVRIEVQDVGARHYVSQGQSRAIVLALKMAELGALSVRAGKVPILLMDDVSSELDRTRNRRLFEALSALGGQVFLTTTHPEFILLQDRRQDLPIAHGLMGG